jgi:hypothetical protein
MGRSARALAYLRQEAVRITESILFVKQHSVNCIGASMFYLSLAFPEFGREAMAEFVESLFTYEGTDLKARAAIRPGSWSFTTSSCRTTKTVAKPGGNAPSSDGSVP